MHKDFVACPFNAKHMVLRHELRTHLAHCADRVGQLKLILLIYMVCTYFYIKSLNCQKKRFCRYLQTKHHILWFLLPSYILKVNFLVYIHLLNNKRQLFILTS